MLEGEEALEMISFVFHKNFPWLINFMSCSFDIRPPRSNTLGRYYLQPSTPSQRFGACSLVRESEKSCAEGNQWFPQLLSHLPSNAVCIINMPSNAIPWNILWEVIQPSYFMNEETVHEETVVRIFQS